MDPAITALLFIAALVFGGLAFGMAADRYYQLKRGKVLPPVPPART